MADAAVRMRRAPQHGDGSVAKGVDANGHTASRDRQKARQRCRGRRLDAGSIQGEEAVRWGAGRLCQRCRVRWAQLVTDTAP